MRKPGLRGRIWPNDLEELLLGAAVLDDHDAIRCWAQAQADVVPEHLVRAAARFGPYLYRRLSSLDVESPILQRLEETYRRSSSHNQRQLAGLQEVLELFGQAGIDAIVVKGAALIALYYRDIGIRSLRDVDVLVPRATAEAVLNVLEGAGWTRPPIPVERLLRNRTSIIFNGPDGRYCDVQWVPLPEFVSAHGPYEFTRAFWDSAREVTVGRVPARTLGAAETLLYAMTVRHYISGGVRWVIDAMTVLRHEQQLDWERLRSHALRTGTAESVQDALTYLRRFFHAPIPDRVLADFASVRQTVMDGLLYRATTSRDRAGQGLLYAIRAYVRMNAHRGKIGLVVGFARFLQDRYRLPTLQQVVPVIANKAIAKIGTMSALRAGRRQRDKSSPVE